MAEVNIYPSITSQEGNWKRNISDAKSLGLTEVCFFPTPTTPGEREEQYALLKETNIKYIPLVHIMSDMQSWELQFFIDTFHTTAFNIHSKNEFPQQYDLSAFKSIIYVETRLCNLDAELPDWPGVCPDFTHIEDAKYQNPNLYKDFMRYLKIGKLKISHVSAIDQTLTPPKPDHTYKSLSDFDYLQHYQQYLPEIIALELNNPLEEQLTVKEYIWKMLHP
jgi:hypothetical protein